MVAGDGYWNATQSPALPGGADRTIGNDQVHVDWETTTGLRPAGQVSVSYHVRFGPHVRKGVHNTGGHKA